MPEKRSWHEDGIGPVHGDWDSPEHLRRTRGEPDQPPPTEEPTTQIGPHGEREPTEPEDFPPSRRGRGRDIEV